MGKHSRLLPMFRTERRVAMPEALPEPSKGVGQFYVPYGTQNCNCQWFVRPNTDSQILLPRTYLNPQCPANKMWDVVSPQEREALMANDQVSPAAVLVELWALGLGHSLVIGHWSLGVRGPHWSLIQRQWGRGEGESYLKPEELRKRSPPI